MVVVCIAFGQLSFNFDKFLLMLVVVFLFWWYCFNSDHFRVVGGCCFLVFYYKIIGHFLSDVCLLFLVFDDNVSTFKFYYFQMMGCPVISCFMLLVLICGLSWLNYNGNLLEYCWCYVFGQVLIELRIVAQFLMLIVLISSTVMGKVSSLVELSCFWCSTSFICGLYFMRLLNY